MYYDWLSEAVIRFLFFSLWFIPRLFPQGVIMSFGSSYGGGRTRVVRDTKSVFVDMIYFK